VVTQLFVDDTPAPQLCIGAVAEVDLGHAGTRQRHREADEFVFRVWGHVQCGGCGIVLRDHERRAVGQDALCAYDAQPAECERAFVKHQFEKLPRMRLGGAYTDIDQVFDMPRLLLKVVRLQEHALRPDNPAAPAHGCSASFNSTARR
jgi:hypothetical protein